MQEKTKTEEQLAKLAKEFHEERRRRVDSGVNQLISTIEGRAFLWDLLTLSRVYGDCYAPSPTDTAFNLGARSVGLNLLNLINALNPESIPTMTKENTCPIK